MNFNSKLRPFMWPQISRIFLPLKLTVLVMVTALMNVAAADLNPQSGSIAKSLSKYRVQSKTVHGKVTDNAGQGLPGVSIKLKGTGIGTTTDLEGRFSIVLENQNATLVFTYMGYVTQEIAVKDQTLINVQLKDNSTSLDEVVVVGYGTQKKITLTGAVSSISNKDIVSTKNENVQNMLTGKVAGVRVVQNSSEPGSFNNSFDIRGLGSPLVVIDGVPRDNITRLDPNDIESISVLKDASAAIYGVRAANGVVLITTKKGNKRVLELSYSGNQGFQLPSGLPQSVNATEYMTLFNERMMHNVNGGSLPFKEADFKPYLDGSKTSTDWYSPVIKDVVPQSQHNLSGTGGSENMNYFFSLGYTKQDGFLRSGDLNYKKYNLRSNINTKITKNLNVDLNINAIMDTKNQPYQDAWWIIRSFWRQLPIQPMFANNNAENPINTQVDGTHPLLMSDQDYSGYKIFNNKWLQSAITLDYQVPFISGLKAKGMFSYDYNLSDNKMYQKEYSQYNYNAANDTYSPVVKQFPNNIRREFYSKPSLLSQVSLNYEKAIAGSHNIKALLLYEESVRQSDNFYATRELSFLVDQLLAGNSLNQQGNMNVNGLYKEANKGLVGRLTYDFKSKYLAEFSFRNDGSSKFDENGQWGFFPSGSLGWRISEEKFIKKSSALSFVDNLKLRASYGKMGDDAASRYQFITGYLYPANGSANRLPAGSVFDGAFVNSLQSLGLPNKNITWFTSKTFDAGVDFDGWNGLLGFTADVFRRDRSGLLATQAMSLPSVVGASLPQENLNGDRTQGIELTANHNNSLGKFKYFVNGNFAYTRTQNRVVVQAKAGNSYEQWKNMTANRYNDIWWGYGTNGQFQSYTDVNNSPTLVGRATLPGDYSYEDWNGDGQITALDLYPIAYNGVPRVNYGLTVGGEFKAFDVNMLFQGTRMVNISYIEQLREPLWGGGSGLQQFMDRWHPADATADPYNPNTQWVPGHFAYTGSLPDPNSGFNIQNGSYLRLKSVELGFTLPSKISSKVGIKNARIYMNGYNIFTLTDVKYVDPEHPSSTYGYLYPLNKTYTMGLNVKF